MNQTRVFVCATPGCGKGRETDKEAGAPCPYCGGRRWSLSGRISLRDTLRFLWRYRGEYLILDPRGWTYRMLMFFGRISTVFGRNADD